MELSPTSRVHWNRNSLRARLSQPFTNGDVITGDGTQAERKQLHAQMGRTLRDAAVLVLLTETPDGLQVVLTQRTAHLNNHAGQIAFPGGRKDDADNNLVATALREAHEEIDANPAVIEVVGQLPRYVTITAFEVTPIVAVSAPQTFAGHAGEVADVFSVPLAHFLTERHWRRDHLIRDGKRREYWAIPYHDHSGERYIWGATAGMLRVFSTHLGFTR